MTLSVKYYFSLFFLFLIQYTQPYQLDIRVANFFPTSKLFRDIYGVGNPSVQAEFACDICSSYQIWSNISYIFSSGKSCPLKIKTHAHLLPVSLGFKHLFYTNNFSEIDFGIGICYSWLKEKNHCTVCNTGNNVGGIFKFGYRLLLKHCDISFFADYLLQNFHVHNPVQCKKKVNAQGLFLGVGIGRYF